MPRLALVLALFACNVPEVVERDCEDRTAYYPDRNEDGVGEPSDVFIGCQSPPGWVENVGNPVLTGTTSGTPGLITTTGQGGGTPTGTITGTPSGTITGMPSGTLSGTTTGSPASGVPTGTTGGTTNP